MDASSPRWEVGHTVVVQEVWQGSLWAARPMTVAVDEGDFVALWFPKGTVWKVPTSPPSRPRADARAERLMSCLARGDWVFVDGEWDVDTLCLMQAGARHAVWVSWLEDGEHWGWYINLQEPFRRTAHALQTMDLMLDVIVDPDLAWRWKDEDELQAMLDWKLIDEPTARAIRDEAISVVARAQANEQPFCDPWPEWRPDPAWERPALPAGWQDVGG